MDIKTKEGMDGGRVIQFSVFMENKVGRLLEVVRLMEDNGVHILALSIIDTADSAIDRFITSDPDLAREVLLRHGMAFSETQVVVVEMAGSTDLRTVLTALLQAECNLHFLYSLLSQPAGRACLALHVEDNELATSVLRSSGFKVLRQNDISR